MRHTAKQVSESDFKKQWAKYKNAYVFFMETTRGDAWGPVIVEGRSLIHMIMGSVGIPSRLNKKFEAASKAILGARSTRNVIKWKARNGKHITLLADAINWPFLSEDEEEQGLRRFPLADFTVHNILGLSEPDLLPLKILIAKAFHQLRRSKVKGIREMLYGDIHLVGKLARNALAWYKPDNDTIYIRPFTSAKKDALHSLMHELGHRFWRKTATPAQKNAWLAHHHAVGRSAPDPWDVSYPSVGDIISIAKERGRGRNRKKPTVVKIEGTPGQGAKFYTEGGGYFTDGQFQDTAATNARWGRFPTNYAATDPVEHFCEALSMYAAGSLKEEASNSFKNIFGGGTVKMGNDKALRAGLIRLAHENPALRVDLLPLLSSKTASQWERFLSKPARNWVDDVTWGGPLPLVLALSGYAQDAPRGPQSRLAEKMVFRLRDELTIHISKKVADQWNVESTSGDWKLKNMEEGDPSASVDIIVDAPKPETLYPLIIKWLKRHKFPLNALGLKALKSLLQRNTEFIDDLLLSSLDVSDWDTLIGSDDTLFFASSNYQDDPEGELDTMDGADPEGGSVEFQFSVTVYGMEEEEEEEVDDTDYRDDWEKERDHRQFLRDTDPE